MSDNFYLNWRQTDKKFKTFISNGCRRYCSFVSAVLFIPRWIKRNNNNETILVIIIILTTRSTGTVHTSAKARLTSVAIRIKIRIRIRDPDRHQNLVICSLANQLPTLPWKFHANPFRSFCAKLLRGRQTDKQRRKRNLLGGGNNIIINRWMVQWMN